MRRSVCTPWTAPVPADDQHAGTTLSGWPPIAPTPSSKPGERGLADVLGLEFGPARVSFPLVLTCCDVTTSPDGELVPAERRLAEIHHPTAPGTWSAGQSSVPRR